MIQSSECANTSAVEEQKSHIINFDLTPFNLDGLQNGILETLKNSNLKECVQCQTCLNLGSLLRLIEWRAWNAWMSGSGRSKRDRRLWTRPAHQVKMASQEQLAGNGRMALAADVHRTFTFVSLAGEGPRALILPEHVERVENMKILEQKSCENCSSI